jgi:hypothetical protein
MPSAFLIFQSQTEKIEWDVFLLVQETSAGENDAEVHAPTHREHNQR